MPTFIAQDKIDHNDDVFEIPAEEVDSWKQSIRDAVESVVSEEQVVETVKDVAKAVEDKIPSNVVDVVEDKIPGAIDWFKKHGWV